MAHNLYFDEKSKSYSFAGNVGKERKEIPWHGLGKFFDRPLTIQEAIESAHADFEVEKGAILHIPTELQEAISRGEKITPEMLEGITSKDLINTHSCTYRKDNGAILGVVGSGYTVVQNMAAFDFINSIVGLSNTPVGAGIIETVGLLGKNGQTIFATAKMPSDIRIGDSKDVINDYILFTNAHDGSSAVLACFTPVRVVCNNTLNAALRNAKNKFYARHTTNVNQRLDLAAQTMKLHAAYMENFAGTMVELTKKTFDNKTVRNLIAEVFLTPENFQLLKKADFKLEEVEEIKAPTVKKIMDVWQYTEEGVGQNVARGSAYWLYNGITGYYTNVKQYTSKEKRFNSICDGGDATNKAQKMLDLVMAY